RFSLGSAAPALLGCRRTGTIILADPAGRIDLEAIRGGDRGAMVLLFPHARYSRPNGAGAGYRLHGRTPDLLWRASRPERPKRGWAYGWGAGTLSAELEFPNRRWPRVR